MKRIPKDKRNQLLLVAMGTMAVLAGLWLLLISPQLSKLDQIAVMTGAAREKLAAMQKTVVEASKLKTALSEAAGKLDSIEQGMPYGDLFLRLTEIIRGVARGPNVDVPQFSPPTTGDVNLFPKFQYKQALLGVGGTAHYHDFGKFVAEIENQFPFMRVQNVELEPTPSLTPTEKERLSFKMEIVALVKPAPQTP
jgi:Tfp pilus assembly protein PilO